ncbi:hypothetical protein QBC40DRAFT_344934 [Triangularia verruculosa]|uniref:Uncharacterized protein n=1 Tax=Triangularia verruculosa TaxID=2587418 RepID=A0AAN7AZ78_9PEZI|nr:hypothetical protein QBC40DRAFT_344934 [Triangularia verruculosa]
MRPSFLLAGNLLVVLGAATPAELQQPDDECIQDELLNCFSSSLVQASQYCTNSVVTATGFTEVVTVTPTVTITNAVTATAIVTQSPPLRLRRRKRGCSHRPPLDCLRSFASSVEPFQVASACSCIGIASTTEVATVTADVTDTVTETPTVTELVTVTLPPLEEEPSQEPTLEPTTTSAAEPTTETSAEETTIEPTPTPTPEPSTTSSVEESTQEPTTTPAPESEPEPTTTTTSVAEPTTSSAPLPEITNGEFNSLEGWTVGTAIGGATAQSVPYGPDPNRALELFTSYFIRSTAASISISQRINCEPGVSYRLTTLYSIMSSYTNGSPWSIVLGGTTIASGIGNSVARTQVSHTFVCSATPAANELSYRIQSHISRQARMLVDSVAVVRV